MIDNNEGDNNLKLGPTFIRPNVLAQVKGDKDIATDLRKEFFDALAPVAALITKANEFGFEVGFQFGPNAFGQVHIQAINLMKKY